MTILLIIGTIALIVLMAGIVDTCALDQITSGSACLNHLSHDEKLAASVFYKCAELAACDSGTCTIDALMTEVACLKELDMARLQSAEVYTDYLNAVAGGASLDGTADELQEGIKCLRLIDPVTLTALKVLLDCRLKECVSGPEIL